MIQLSGKLKRIKMKKNTIESVLAICAVMASAVIARLIPHIPNVAPIAALALFSGMKIPKWKGFFIPLLVMLISDYFLGFHATLPFVYVSFFLIGGIGYLLRNRASALNIVVGSLVGSLLFFLITNFGVWFTSSMYEKNMGGLLKCYMMGLPFFRNTVIGDIFYTAVFFLGYSSITLLFVLMLPSRRKTERHIGNTV